MCAVWLGCRWCFFLVLLFMYHSLLRDHCDPETKAAKLAVRLSTKRHSRCEVLFKKGFRIVKSHFVRCRCHLTLFEQALYKLHTTNDTHEIALPHLTYTAHEQLTLVSKHSSQGSRPARSSMSGLQLSAPHQRTLPLPSQFLALSPSLTVRPKFPRTYRPLH